MAGTHLDVVQGAAGREIPYLQGSTPVKGGEIIDLPLVPAVAGEHAVARTLTRLFVRKKAEGFTPWEKGAAATVVPCAPKAAGRTWHFGRVALAEPRRERGAR